jgi:alkaline phosphatase
MNILKIRNILLLVQIILLSVSCTGNTKAQVDPTNGFDFTIANTTPKHIILFIGDGMQYSNEVALSRYLHGTDTGLSWQDFDYRNFVTTWDIDTYNRFARQKGVPAFSEDDFNPLIGYDPEKGGSEPWGLPGFKNENYFFRALPTMGGGDNTYAIPATDSASAATALATGIKTDTGNISWESGDPPGGGLTSIAEILKQAGMAIGIVTTVEFSHATPAAFAAHSTSRGNTGEISQEIIHATEPDVVAGAGHPDWVSGYISGGNVEYLQNSGEWVFVERQNGVDGSTSILHASEEAVLEDKKLFGLYGGSTGCFGPTVVTDSPGNPSRNIKMEDPTLASAVEASLKVLSQNEDGFFLMVEQGDIDWANHYNDYGWMVGAMWDLNDAVEAAKDFIDIQGDDVTWENTLVIITADHVTGGLRLSEENRPAIGDLPEQHGEKYHYNYPGGEIDYLTTQHTNEPVMIYAQGAGIDLFAQYHGMWYPGTSLIDDTQIYEVMMEFAGVTQ